MAPPKDKECLPSECIIKQARKDGTILNNIKRWKEKHIEEVIDSLKDRVGNKAKLRGGDTGDPVTDLSIREVKEAGTKEFSPEFSKEREKMNGLEGEEGQFKQLFDAVLKVYYNAMHAYQEKKLVGIKPTMNRPRAASDASTMTTQTDDLCGINQFRI